MCQPLLHVSTLIACVNPVLIVILCCDPKSVIIRKMVGFRFAATHPTLTLTTYNPCYARLVISKMNGIFLNNLITHSHISTSHTHTGAHTIKSSLKMFLRFLGVNHVRSMRHLTDKI